MYYKRHKFRQKLSLFMAMLVLAMSFQGIPVKAEGEHVSSAVDYFKEPQFTVKTFVNTMTENSYHATVVVENIGDEKIENWYLTFQMEDTIDTIWDAEIVEQNGSTYMIKNDQDNQDILANDWISFGYTATYEGDTHLPHDIYMPTELKEIGKDELEISFKKNEDVIEYNELELVMTNRTDREMNDWFVEFDLQAEDIDFSGAKLLAANNDHYIVKSEYFNGKICQESFSSFAIMWTGEGDILPGNVKVYTVERIPLNAFDYASKEAESEESFHLGDATKTKELEVVESEEPQVEDIFETVEVQEEVTEESAEVQETVAEESAEVQETETEESIEAQETVVEESTEVQETEIEESTEEIGEESVELLEAVAEESTEVQESETEESAEVQESETEESKEAQEAITEESAETQIEDTKESAETEVEGTTETQEAETEETIESQEAVVDEIASSLLDGFSEETVETEEELPELYDEEDKNYLCPWKIYIGLDSDGDDIPDEKEFEIGLDPYDQDTDGDGLSDKYEFLISEKLKTEDSEDLLVDVLPDDDYDGDGLSNIEEYHWGSSPIDRDTDGDKLIDGDEVYTYNSHPANYDTDKDGMGDGLEISLGLNPQKKDTDDNGILDGDEITTQTINYTKTFLLTKEDVVSLQITGKGDYWQKISIIEKESTEEDEFNRYSFECSGDVSFDEATVSFSYANGLYDVENIDNLVIAQYNESGTLEILESTIDKEAKKIVAKIETLGDVKLLDIEKYYRELNYTYLDQNTVSEIFEENEYILLDEALDWDEAEEFAKEIDAEVAVIDTPEEKEFLDEFISKNGKKDQYWVKNNKDEPLSEENASAWKDGKITPPLTLTAADLRENTYSYHVSYTDPGTGFTDRIEIEYDIESPLPLFVVYYAQNIPGRNGGLVTCPEIFAYDANKNYKSRSYVWGYKKNISMKIYSKRLTFSSDAATKSWVLTNTEEYLSREKFTLQEQYRITTIGPNDIIKMYDQEYCRTYLAGYSIYNTNIPTFGDAASPHGFFGAGIPMGQLNPNARYTTTKNNKTNSGTVFTRNNTSSGKCLVYLEDEKQQVTLNANPLLKNVNVDSDCDGIPDTTELIKCTGVKIPTGNQMGLLRDENRVVQVWTCFSNPKNSDTDKDGYRDDNDRRPKKLDVRITSMSNEIVALNTGRVYRYTGVNISEHNVKKRLDLLYYMSGDAYQMDYKLKCNDEEFFLNEELALLWRYDPRGVNFLVDRKGLITKRAIYKLIVNNDASDSAVEEFFKPNSTYDEELSRYYFKTLKQVVFGSFNKDEETFWGHVISFGIGFTPAALLTSGRDLAYDYYTLWDDNPNNDASCVDFIIDGISVYQDGKGLKECVQAFKVKDMEQYIGIYKCGDDILEFRRFFSMDELRQFKNRNMVPEVECSAKKAMKGLNKQAYDNMLDFLKGSDKYLMHFKDKDCYNNIVIQVLLISEVEVEDIYPYLLDDMVEKLYIKAKDDAWKNITKKEAKELIDEYKKLGSKDNQSE